MKNRKETLKDGNQTLLTLINVLIIEGHKLEFHQPQKETMSHYHAVVWLDHSEAHVMHITADDVEKLVVHPAKPHHHLQHSKSGAVLGGNPTYYCALLASLPSSLTCLDNT